MGARSLVVATVLVTGGCARVFGLTPLDAPDAPGPASWTSVIAGHDSTCAIRGSDGALYCWGRGDAGQLGLDAVIESDVPVRVGADAWLQLSMLTTSVCGIQIDHTLWCWGDNGRGQLGLGDQRSRTTPTQLGSKSWSRVSVGTSHACAIDTEGQLWCWGDNGDGAVGDIEDMTILKTPNLITDVGPWVDVAAGDDHSCAVKQDGTLWCFGRSDLAQCGMASPPVLTPRQVAFADPARAWSTVVAGNAFTCAVDRASHAACWGADGAGQLGNGAAMPSSPPIALDNDTGDWLALSAGETHACGVKTDGSAYCWGAGTRGELAVETAATATPMRFGDRAWRVVSAGGSHTCAIDTTDAVWCVGLGGVGELGDGVGSRVTPAKVPGTWLAASAGAVATCAVDATTNQLLCWGDNGSGELGDGTQLGHQTAKVILGASGPWQAIAVGFTSTCGIAATGRRVCWGDNSGDALGAAGSVATGGVTATPVVMTDAGSWVAVAEERHGCAIDKNKALSCWGLNDAHQVNPTGVASINAPGVEPVVGVTGVSVGIQHTCAALATGAQSSAISCWGANTNNQIGIPGGTGVDPAVVISLAAGGAVTAGGLHSCAWQLDGTRWCWGRNSEGQLGTGGTTNASAPVQMADGPWRQLDGGLLYTCGLHFDGSLWCWGDNAFGELGDGSFVTHATPERVGTDTDWDTLSAGDFHACATKRDGTLWCWGRALSGEIGDGMAWRSTLAPVLTP